jgi:HAD superfamily hydrolase (TIGR01450 family)
MLAQQFDAFLIDLDGVIYVGSALLPGVSEALQRLRLAGKAIRFLTNDPRPTRRELVERLNRLGVEVRVEELVTSGWATARYLRDRGIRTVSVLGSVGLRTELELSGIEVTDHEVPEAVVVGADERLGYLDLLRASRLILQGARFVALNVDRSFPLPDGPAPATGAVVSALEAATGQRPVVVGKPATPMFELALASFPLGCRVVMVGDNPEADVVGAHQAGIPAILVASEPPRWPAANDFRVPDTCIRTLLELFEPGRSIRQWARPPYRWPERVVAVIAAVVLDRAGRVLVLRDTGSGRWQVPWGPVERGESVTEAVVRVVREQAGIEAQVLRMTGVYSEPALHVVAAPSGEIIQTVACCFLCRADNLESPRTDGGRAQDMAVVLPDALPSGISAAQRRWLSDALGGESGIVVR